MFILISAVFLVLATLIAWSVWRVPIRGDVQMQLMWRGAVAGLVGGIFGATLASMISGLRGYSLFGYIYCLIITGVLGILFTYLIGVIQKSRLKLNLLGRAVIGGCLGIATAWLWASLIRTDLTGSIDSFGKGIICMLISSGIVSGILGGPMPKEG